VRGRCLGWAFSQGKRHGTFVSGYPATGKMF
jgi:hypothetical protein